MRAAALLIAILPGWAASAAAQDSLFVPRATRAAGPLRLDGVPDEPSWLATDSITDFRQRDHASRNEQDFQ